jgi:tellurite resistance protein
MSKIRTRVVVTTSKFAMWRCAIALAHCDGQLSNSEINLIHDYWENFDFSNAQVRQLEEDFRSSLLWEDVFFDITEKLDRAHLINFARVLFHIDGDFSAVEQELLQKIYDKHMETVDLRQAIRDASTVAKAYVEEARELDKLYKPTDSWLMKAFGYLATFGGRDLD